MINLSECKFGDRLKTRDGRMAIFCEQDNYGGYCLVLEGEKQPFMIVDRYDCDGICHFFKRADGKFDIVGKWEDDV